MINSRIGDQPAQGSANGLGFALHISEPGMVDRWLFGGVLPTIWLQDLAHRPSGPRWYDGVAALISVLLAVFLFSSARWWARMLLVAYPILMGLSLVYTGEHYVIDVLVGWLVAAAAVWVVGQRRTGPSRGLVPGREQ